jgi:hypothetical protein
LILLLFVFPGAQHEAIIVTSFWLFSIAVDDSGDFFVENTVMNISFLRMKIFIKGGSDDAVSIDSDAELFSDFSYICIVSIIKKKLTFFIRLIELI